MLKTLTRISTTVVGGLEGFFFWYGFKVAQFPWYVSIFCVVFSGLCGLGLLNYTEENNAFRLWIPSDSAFVKNYEWLQENYPPDSRYNNIIVSGDNVLTPEFLKLLLQIHNEVKKVKTQDGKTWQDLCQRIPVNPSTYLKEKVVKKPNCSSNHMDLDDLNLCQHDAYCQAFANVETDCLETGILELWGYNSSVYDNLTQEQILEDVNKDPLASQVFFNKSIEIGQYLSVVTNEETGKIVRAKAATISWFGKVNKSALTEEDMAGAEGGQAADQTTLEFEDRLRIRLEELGDELLQPQGLELFVNVARGYIDVAGEQIMNDALLMPVGFTLVGLYVMLMLGHFHCVETRAFLSGVGIAIIGLTILVTYGLCSAVGLFFGPMHNAIPFLFLGIGIDDMFVIVQSLDNLKPEERQVGNIPQNIGQTMKHAGVAITVTSITDIVVFAVGASTRLPSLQSFCLYCAVGIMAVFFFQATLFVACVALDLRRIHQHRNGVLFCYKHDSYDEPKVTEELGLRRKIFRSIGVAINNIFGKILVFLATFTLLGFGIWGMTQLETKFESSWFLPPESYVARWFDASEQYFPGDGQRVTVYITGIDYANELKSISQLTRGLENATGIVSSVNSWYPSLEAYINYKIGIAEDFEHGIPDVTLDLKDFYNYTSFFLFSPSGLAYQPNFMTSSDPLLCNETISQIDMTTFEFIHTRFDSTPDHIAAMEDIYSMISDLKFSNSVFPITQEYANWETDAVIASELYRNIGLSMACVFVTMLILLADIWGSILVMLCVMMTLVDVMGYMHFWGLTIDVVSSIVVIISIGLCVDYSAHIGHAFLTQKGSKKERSIVALQNIGPAVLNGGFSTFLALVLLVTSDSYVFSTFFKVFFLVIVFGLFHGLIFLPALLSVIGPRAYVHDDKKPKTDDVYDGDGIANPSFNTNL